MADLQAFANITIEGTPSDSSHLVTVSYVSDRYVPWQVVAPLWSSSASYVVGDIVYYIGQLYRCTTNNPTTPPLMEVDWTKTYLTNVATTTTYGLVRPDSTTINVSNGNISIKPATTSSLGGVVVGKGLAVSSGVCSAAFGRREICICSPGVVLYDDIYNYCVEVRGDKTFSFDTSQLTSLSGYDIEFNLIIAKADSGFSPTYTFPSSLVWLGDAPSFSSDRSTFLIYVRSYDGGSSWLAEFKGVVGLDATLTLSRESMLKPINIITPTSGGDAVVVLDGEKSLYSVDLSAHSEASITFDSSHLVLPSVAYTQVIVFDLFVKVANSPSVNFVDIGWLDFEQPRLRNGTYIFSFISFDGGTTWLGSQKGSFS